MLALCLFVIFVYLVILECTVESFINCLVKPRFRVVFCPDICFSPATGQFVVHTVLLLIIIIIFFFPKHKTVLKHTQNILFISHAFSFLPL